MLHHLPRNLLLLGLSCLLLVLTLGVAVAGPELVTVQGKIVAISFAPPAPLKGTLEIKKFWGGRETVHVGFKTRYVPVRAPQLGDKVTAECILVKGRLAAKVIRFDN